MIKSCWPCASPHLNAGSHTLGYTATCSNRVCVSRARRASHDPPPLQETKSLFLIGLKKLDGLIQFHTMFLRLFPLSICSSLCPEGVLPNLLTTESGVQHQLLILASGILSKQPPGCPFFPLLSFQSHVHICSSQIVVSLRDKLPPLATVEQVMS